jgi:tryptophan-rich sensory protein
MSPWLTAFVACLFGVIAESLLAGNNVREHLRQVKQPRGSPPMWLWIAIGLAYYIVYYTILFRLFARGGDGMHNLAVGLAIVILAANAFWNYLFFRAKNFLACLLFSLGYGVVVVALLVLLVRIDRTSAFVLLPYVAYLTYAGWLQHSIWRLNS